MGGGGGHGPLVPPPPLDPPLLVVDGIKSSVWVVVILGETPSVVQLPLAYSKLSSRCFDLLGSGQKDLVWRNANLQGGTIYRQFWRRWPPTMMLIYIRLHASSSSCASNPLDRLGKIFLAVSPCGFVSCWFWLSWLCNQWIVQDVYGLIVGCICYPANFCSKFRRFATVVYQDLGISHLLIVMRPSSTGHPK